MASTKLPLKLVFCDIFSDLLFFFYNIIKRSKNQLSTLKCKPKDVKKVFAKAIKNEHNIRKMISLLQVEEFDGQTHTHTHNS